MPVALIGRRSSVIGALLGFARSAVSATLFRSLNIWSLFVFSPKVRLQCSVAQ
jgi:hypothetical protein